MWRIFPVMLHIIEQKVLIKQGHLIQNVDAAWEQGMRQELRERIAMISPCHCHDEQTAQEAREGKIA